VYLCHGRKAAVCKMRKPSKRSARNTPEAILPIVATTENKPPTETAGRPDTTVSAPIRTAGAELRHRQLLISDGEGKADITK
jgi:hypothetical protein